MLECYVTVFHRFGSQSQNQVSLINITGGDDPREVYAFSYSLRILSLAHPISFQYTLHKLCPHRERRAAAQGSMFPTGSSQWPPVRGEAKQGVASATKRTEAQT